MQSRLLFKDGGGLGGVVMIQALSDSTFTLPSALFEALTAFSPRSPIIILIVRVTDRRTENSLAQGQWFRNDLQLRNDLDCGPKVTQLPVFQPLSFCVSEMLSLKYYLSRERETTKNSDHSEV